jgi:hypothetical protein
MPRCRLTTTAQTVGADNSWTTVVEDTHGMFDVGTPTVVTIPDGQDGVYAMSFGSGWDSLASGTAGAVALLHVNGTARAAAAQGTTGSSGDQYESDSGCLITYLVGGDEISVQWSANGAGVPTHTQSANSILPFLDVLRLV